MRAWRSMTYPLAKLAAFPFHHRFREEERDRLQARQELGISSAWEKQSARSNRSYRWNPSMKRCCARYAHWPSNCIPILSRWHGQAIGL